MFQKKNYLKSREWYFASTAADIDWALPNMPVDLFSPKSANIFFFLFLSFFFLFLYLSFSLSFFFIFIFFLPFFPSFSRFDWLTTWNSLRLAPMKYIFLSIFFSLSLFSLSHSNVICLAFLLLFISVCKA